MSTKNFRKWILVLSLGLGIAGVYGYQSILVKQEQAVCKEQVKEGQDKKVDASAPIWESLSSHLIMQSRN